MSESQQSMLSSVFKECDTRGTGYLTREDLKVAIVSVLGYKPCGREVDSMIQNVDMSQGMPPHIFSSIMQDKLSAIDEDQTVRQTFLAFDTRCQGFLTVEDFSKVLHQVAPHLASHRIHNLFREIDRDGDGKVSYSDFYFMMKYSTDDGF